MEKTINIKGKVRAMNTMYQSFIYLIQQTVYESANLDERVYVLNRFEHVLNAEFYSYDESSKKPIHLYFKHQLEQNGPCVYEHLHYLTDIIAFMREPGYPNHCLELAREAFPDEKLGDEELKEKYINKLVDRFVVEEIGAFYFEEV